MLYELSSTSVSVSELKSNNSNCPDISVVQSWPDVIFWDSPSTAKAIWSLWYPFGSFSFSTLNKFPITIPPIPSNWQLNFRGITADLGIAVIGIFSPFLFRPKREYNKASVDLAKDITSW